MRRVLKIMGQSGTPESILPFEAIASAETQSRRRGKRASVVQWFRAKVGRSVAESRRKRFSCRSRSSENRRIIAAPIGTDVDENESIKRVANGEQDKRLERLVIVAATADAGELLDSNVLSVDGANAVRELP